MNNENCYGCVNLRKFSKEEQEEVMEVWRKAKKSGALKCLADTNPHIAECKIQGYMTGTVILRFDNCKHYKLGEKSKKQIFEEFKKSGYYGEVLSEDEKEIKLCATYSPEYDTKAALISKQGMEDLRGKERIMIKKIDLEQRKKGEKKERG